ncbi:MAG: glycosyltransferase [Chlorobium phaeobacteroides]|jgi:glycosyltransferase involved in cell wall biosynthesis|nr:glycosyltransferase [Chlorobium phaeobacteroides]
MQGIQSAEHSQHTGIFCLSFTQSIVRNRGRHEVILALSGRFPQTIDRLRGLFDGLLPQDEIVVRHCPRLDDTSENGLSRETAKIIRHTFFCGLKPDIVYLTGWNEDHQHHDVCNQGDPLPFTTVLHDAKQLQCQSESLRRAALLFTDTSIQGKLNESIPGISKEIIFNLPFIAENGRLSHESIHEDEWDRIGKEALFGLEVWKNNDTSHNSSPIRQSCRPKLAYVSPLPPERSGISDYSAELLPELFSHYDIDLILDQEDVAVPFITSRCPIRSPEYFRENADKYDRVIYHFGNSPFHKHMFALLEDVPGIVILHDFFLSDIIAYLDNNGIKTGAWADEIYHAHGYKALGQFMRDHDKTVIVQTYPCNYSVLNSAEGVIVHSEYAKQLGVQWYGKKAVDHWAVIPHLRKQSTIVQRAEARKALHIAEHCFVVCSFGLLGPHKMNNRLLDAWLASSLAEDDECLLVFVGENTSCHYGKKILETIERNKNGKRVFITGWASHEMFRMYLAAADAGVQLRTQSRGETSGTVLDCMNYGLPTIINANGSMAELPKESTIMLKDDFSDIELIEALELLRNNPVYRMQLGNLARIHIQTSHNPAEVTMKYVEAIEAFSTGPEKQRSNAINALARIKDLPEDEKNLTEIASAVSATMQPRCRRKQLLIDVSALVQEDLKTGIQRVVRSIIKNFIDNAPDNLQVEPVYSTSGNVYCYARRFTLQVLGCPSHGFEDEPVDVYAGDILFIPDPHFQIVKTHNHFLQHIRNIGARIIFLVHDILPVRYPEYFPDSMFGEFQGWLNTVVHSDGAICVTRTVADDLFAWINVRKPERHRPFQIGWNHHGADITASIPSKGLPEGFQQTIDTLLKNPTILMVGTVEPRKGHALALQAIELLWSHRIYVNLVIVGKHGWMIDVLADRIKQHSELNQRLFWFQGISDEALVKLYHTATGVLMASEGEGFGLPLIEAAQYGCPVLARDIPVFREIAGEHVTYFSGNTPDALAESLQAWIHNLKNNTAPDSGSMHWLTWDASCHKLLAMIIDNRHEQWIYQYPLNRS